MSYLIRVVCIKRSNVYAHHRNLEIGKEYLLQDNGDSVYIKNLDGSGLGFYPREFFVDTVDWRDDQIKKLIDSRYK